MARTSVGGTFIFVSISMLFALSGGAAAQGTGEGPSGPIPECAHPSDPDTREACRFATLMCNFSAPVLMSRDAHAAIAACVRNALHHGAQGSRSGALRNRCLESQDADTVISACTSLIDEGDATDAELSDYFTHRGVQRAMKDDFDRALSDYAQAIRHNPRNADPYLFRGLYWYSRKRYDLSLADYNNAVALSANSFDVHSKAFCGRGVVRFKMGDEAGTAADINTARQLDPNACK